MNCFNKKPLCLALIAVSALSMLAAAPEVSNVTMQQIEHSRNVRITYDLAVTNAIITLAIETNGVALPDSAVVTLSGDVNKLVTADEDREIIWNAGVDWAEQNATNVRAMS